jgi:hypothetical protein
MKDFNENPFARNTKVRPFSNGTEAMAWHEFNCDQCINYEDESQTENEAKCKLAYNLDEGYITGEIELWVAKEIGCKYDPLYGSCTLDNKCNQFRTGNEPF